MDWSPEFDLYLLLLLLLGVIVFYKKCYFTLTQNIGIETIEYKTYLPTVQYDHKFILIIKRYVKRCISVIIAIKNHFVAGSR